MPRQIAVNERSLYHDIQLIDSLRRTASRIIRKSTLR